MNYKDGSWWVCCAFIIIISYTLGKLTGIPTWSATDSKLSAFSNFATSLAGIATLAAAFYAYKSFNSWEERVKKQHRLEQKLQALKDFSIQYHQTISSMEHLLVLKQGHIDVTRDIILKRKKGDDKSSLEERENKVNSLSIQIESVQKYLSYSIAKYSDSYAFFEALHNISNMEEFTPKSLKSFYLETEKKLDLLGRNNVFINLLSTKMAEDSLKISSLYKELFDDK